MQSARAFPYCTTALRTCFQGVSAAVQGILDFFECFRAVREFDMVWSSPHSLIVLEGCAAPACADGQLVLRRELVLVRLPLRGEEVVPDLL